MFAVVTQLHFTQPVAQFREAMAQEGLTILSSYPGFLDFKLLEVSETHAIALIFWQDGSSAQHGFNQFGPAWLAHHVQPYLAQPWQRDAGPVTLQYE